VFISANVSGFGVGLGVGARVGVGVFVGVGDGIGVGEIPISFLNVRAIFCDCGTIVLCPMYAIAGISRAMVITINNRFL